MTQQQIDMYQKRLNEYLAAEEAILSGAQSYRIGSRQLQRGDLSKIADMIAYLERQLAAAKAESSGQGRNKVFGIVPRDY